MSQKVILFGSIGPFVGERGPGTAEIAPPDLIGIRLTPQMLEWPIMAYDETGVLRVFHQANMFRECLKALFELEPFTAGILLHCDRPNKCLQMSKFDWCNIYFCGKTVLSLTHHAGGEVCYNFTEWPGVDSTVCEWEERRWRRFFRESVLAACAERERRARQYMEPHEAVVAFNSTVIQLMPKA